MKLYDAIYMMQSINQYRIELIVVSLRYTSLIASSIKETSYNILSPLNQMKNLAFNSKFLKAWSNFTTHRESGYLNIEQIRICQQTSARED